MTPEHCRELERLGRAMLGTQLSIVETACAFIQQELDAGNRLPLSSCVNHAMALHHLLTREGMSARIVGGEAFWSLGPGEDDAIWFSQANGPDGFHCWVVVDTPAGSVCVDCHAYVVARIAAYEGIKPTWVPSPALIWRPNELSVLVPANAQHSVWLYHPHGLPMHIRGAFERN